MNQFPNGRARFVFHPRTIDELKCPDMLNNRELNYEIMTTVTLDHIDYENFITDMIVSRDFLEKHTMKCGADEKAKCLLIMGKCFSGGILVVPQDEGFVKYAAIYE